MLYIFQYTFLFINMFPIKLLNIVLPRGQNELMLTPASFIEINSVMVVNDQYEGKHDSTSAALGLHSVASLETGPISLISETRQCSDNMLLQLHCKVVAVYVLVLEKNREVVHPPPRTYSSPPLVNVPLAGFVLDDGSSSCCCWATNERATTLLKLHEVNLFEVLGRTLRRSKQAWLNNARSSKHDRVDKILHQHGRVVVKNYGSTFDSTLQDLSVSVGADKIISSSDEKFLKFHILNACFGTTFWTVVGRLMDSNATEQLEKRLMQLDMPMLPLQNIWAREVFQPNPVSEARNIIEELLNMKQVSILVL